MMRRLGRPRKTAFGPSGRVVASLAAILLMVSLVGCARRTAETPPDVDPAPDFVGSKTCHDCHKDFYRLWATSRHGLAMQPYTPEFGLDALVPQADETTIGKNHYRAEIDDRGGRIRQRGPDGRRTYPIKHVMGGKNVYYFLTPLERGRLQVLPLAYDVHKKTWYDTTASGVRHFPDRRDEALPWTDRMFTFNTACFNCHVSQLCTNYNPASDSYRTTWSEPGISCESCHGPAGEHLRVMEAAEDPNKVSDIKIIRTKQFTARQMNDMCASCHAKLVPLSLDFRPGDRFFDHFDLIVLDHPDYHADGRDLGENYTHTSWMMSPCANSGKLDCNHCHTPSGRLRYTGARTNELCAPCHQNYVDDPASHGHHAPGSKGNDCIGCHMPTTRFAGMGRTDHSMLPPTPAATVALKSPNACNLCHADKDAKWSDTYVRKWYPRDYQAPVMERALLLEAARKHDWRRLPEMLEKIAGSDENAVYRASLVRLMRGCRDNAKWLALIAALDAKSPLVRSSAAAALADRLDEKTIPRLLAATRDPSRLVRIRAAAALAPVPLAQIGNPKDHASLERAVEEFQAAMRARPDDWTGYANLGTFHLERREFQKAVDCFTTASRLEPRNVEPMISASIAHGNLGQNDRAETVLRRALELEPRNPAALLNLGLLLAEERRIDEAETAFRAALASDPHLAAAAFNLGVLCGQSRIDEAVRWCRKAHEIQPNNVKFAQALAFFLQKKGKEQKAAEVLRALNSQNQKPHK